MAAPNLHWKKPKKKNGEPTIVMHVNEESKEFLEAHRLKDILKNSAAFYRYLFFLSDEQINNTNSRLDKEAF